MSRRVNVRNVAVVTSALAILVGLPVIATTTITTNSLATTGTLQVDGNSTFDTTTMYVDANNNRVGIRTTSPSEALEVSGGAVTVASNTSSTIKIKAGTSSPSASKSANLEFYNTNSSRQWSVINDLNENGTNGLTFTKANSSAVLHLNQSGQVKVSGTDAQATLDVGGDFAFRRNATDVTTTGTQANVSFGSYSNAAFSGSSDITISGISGGVDGKFLNIINRSASSLMTLTNDDSGSSAANRIITGTGGSLTVPAGGIVTLQHDYNLNGSGARWRVVGGPALTGWTDDGTTVRLNSLTDVVGIGTSSPQSALHVADGKYAQFEDNNAGAPAAGDCDADTERGRLSIDTTNNRLYVCNGASRGWDFVSLTD